MSLSKLNEKEIATITFKYKTAQRRFEEGTIWDRLKQESLIYNGDTIRTADHSEATLHFIDGNEMSLTDNTMTQVFLNEDNKLKALLSGGSITVDSSNASENSRGIVLSYNDVEVELEAGTTLNASSSEDDDFAVQVFNGSATVTSKDGVKQNILQGDKFAVSKDGTPKATLSVTKPLPNAKVINHTKESMTVPFEWKIKDSDESFNYILEIASDAGFKNIENTINAGTETSVSTELSNGQSYYRITCNDTSGNKRASITGKIQLIESKIPQPVAPVADYEYNYRKNTPAVRFLWTESKYATSYELVVSTNPNFINPIIVQRTALPSSIIKSLGNGKYYWRVTPFYTINNLGLDGTSEVSTFEIHQQGKLSVPALIFPQQNSFVNTKTASKKINFSWKLDPESVNYNLVIADNPGLKNPKISRTTDINYYPLNPGEENLTNGTWYWSVCGIDDEGNRSDFSEPRSFYAVDGEVIQRTIYPPDQYNVAQTLIRDIRFTWKSNLPFDREFEISTDENFNRIIYKQNVHDNTISGINLAVGTYYWRIISKSDQNSFPSPTKKLVVLGPLEAPVPIAPDVAKRALVRPDTPFDFTWKSAEGANYYKVTVKNPASDDILFERNLIEGNKCSINMENIPEGYYVWSVQGFSYETELQTRRTGKIAEAKFELKKIHPVELVSPADNFTMEGVDAILNPSTITWRSRDVVKKAEFLLIRTDLKTPEVVARVPVTSYTQRLPRLHSGTYTWTVIAESVDGFDLSPTSPRHFNITPVAPLNTATKLVPANRTKFDAAYFKDNKQINFTWAPVKDATHYIFRLQKRNGTVLVEEKIKQPKYTYSDIKNLESANFTWSVEAIRCIEDGTTLQESIPAKSTFIVELPKLKATKLKEGVMYGK